MIKKLRHRHGVYRKLVAAAVAAVAMAFTLAGAAGAAQAAMTPASPRPVPAQHPVPVHVVPSHKVATPVMKAWKQPSVSWPAAGVGTAAVPTGAAHAALAVPASRENAALASPSTGSVRAGGLPVWVGPAAQAGHATVALASAPAESQVRVAMASRKTAAAAGVSGVIFSLSSASPGPATPVHVSLDYSSFAFADEGDFASRLHLVELPGCALTTPQLAACRRQVSLGSADDVSDFRLGADVTVPAQPMSEPVYAAAPATAVVLAATTSTSGSAGSFGATPLSEAGTWTAGGSSGAFSYSYPIDIPPVPGGLAPQVSLDYDSQATDGLTSSTNDQASWIGDGWDYEPGYIERDYQSCETEPPGAANWVKSGDLCWSSNDTTTLSLGGVTTTLVDDPTNGWHTEADNGDKITYLTGAGNSTTGGGYWEVTDPDGTSYFFGEDHLPGWVSGDTSANSSWNVPVYGYESGDPCYNATAANAHCYLPWRWNLDYVTDSHGDAEALFYSYEQNYYAEDNGTTGSAAYVQGGVLSKIEYGLRAGSIYGSTAGTLDTPAAQVTFTSAANRTDIPSDLACASGAACDVISPTFWIEDRLTSIATSTHEGSGSTMDPVDSWALAQNYPATGDGSAAPPMWLESITRTGEDGTSIALPPVTFSGISLANRVETEADTNDGYSIIDRFRLSSVTSETGGVTSVSYDTPPSSCTSGNFPATDQNKTLCYPDYWTPPGASSPIEDWFNKYVVTSVTEANTAGGTLPVTDSYTYSGAAWHYDDDSLTRESLRTWDQWRGFGTVTTETGNAADSDPVTETTDTYFQGMNGDYQDGNPVTSATLSATVGGVTASSPDDDQFAGMGFTHTVNDGAGGAVVSETATTPWTSAATATQSQPSPLPALTAYMTGTAKTQTFTALASGGYREADDIYAHDSSGRVTSDFNAPDAAGVVPGDANEDTCTQTTYAANTSSWLLDLPKEVTVTSVSAAADCPVTLPPTSAEIISDTESFYDGATSLSPDTPSAGNLTMTEQATSYSGATEEFSTESQDAYDEYGRVTSAKNADAIADGYAATTTAYSPATSAEPTLVTVTDPMSLITKTTYDPARDLPLTVTNPAGYVTTETYDALGRLTAAWTPGHAVNGPADETHSYEVSNSGPSVVTTNTINASGSALPSETLYDSLGREIETQTETPDGNMNVTDTYYNTDGWVLTKSNSYIAAGGPTDNLVAADDGTVPSQTGYVYDGDGRVIREITYNKSVEQWETDTSYGGDYTTVTPPAGGTATTTYTNGDGQESYLYQYHSATPPTTPPTAGSGTNTNATTGWDQTSYAYTTAGQLQTVTDAAGKQWSYHYDLAGDQTSAADPDTGTTTSTYDLDGNLLSTTDARTKTISYTYDADGRKTFEYDTTGGAAETGSDELATWAYDSLAKGQVTGSISYPTGTSGPSYAEVVSGYNSLDLPEGENVNISSGTFNGSFDVSYGYTNYANLVSETQYPADAGLPAEEVGTGYDTANKPVSLESSQWDYVSGLSYTDLNQPEEYTLGTSASPAWIIDSYDPVTGNLSTSGAQAGTSPITLDSTTYNYDNDGLITSDADTPANGGTQVQCFSYDYLGRLSQAWSQGGTGCSSGASQTAESTAAAPYWEQYAYNDENDLTSETSTPASGAATTTTDAYAGTPHQITQQQAVTGSTTNTSSYSYDADGDTQGITLPSGNETLNWNDAGKLASVDAPGSTTPTTSYIYDADGNLLEETDPSGTSGTTDTTLYLPGEELVAATNSSGTTFSGTRYYTIGGVTIAARTSAGQVYYLDGNQQGTATLAINSSTLTGTNRYYDPYGNPVGTAPSSWPGAQGFVGGTADPATSLENLGAREYNSATSSFVSTDPLRNAYDPQDLNPYAYSLDDPVNQSDPSGAQPIYNVPEGTCTGSGQSCETVYNNQQQGLQQQARDNRDESTTVDHDYIFNVPITVIERTPRAVTPVQQSIGSAASASCAGGRDAALDPTPCTFQHPAGGGSGGISFGWLSTAAGWVGHQFRAHWRGMLQTAVFASCLSVAIEICLGAEGGGLLINFVANGIGTGNWTGAAETLGEGALIDAVTLPASMLLGNALDGEISAISGLEPAASDATRGAAGRFLGAYTPKYAPSVSWYYPGINQATKYGSNLAPEFLHMAYRSAMNEVSCNGTTLDYCLWKLNGRSPAWHRTVRPEEVKRV